MKKFDTDSCVFFTLTGLFLGIAVMKNINEKPWEKNVGWVTLALFLVFVSFAIFFNGLYQGYPETDWTPCCPQNGCHDNYRQVMGQNHCLVTEYNQGVVNLKVLPCIIWCKERTEIIVWLMFCLSHSNTKLLYYLAAYVLEM